MTKRPNPLQKPLQQPRRRAMLLAGFSLALPASVWAVSPRKMPVVQVWKDPNCGCCQLWVDYLKANGFEVKTFDVGNAEMRAKLGLHERYASCHTGLVNGYVLEGHVPVEDIRKLLKDQPKALGLAVPGMPIGSPGMDGPEYKGRRDAYKVLLVQADGTAKEFSRYSAIPPKVVT